MPDYDALRATAARLVANFGSGRTVTFYRTDDPDYDPVADTPPPPPTPYTVIGVVVPRGANDISTPFDRRVETEYIKIIVPANGLPIIPRPGDFVEVPGRPGLFGVTDCKPVAPDGDNIVSIVNAERAATT